MGTNIWVFPEAMGPGLDSIWEGPSPGLAMMAEMGEVFRLAPTGPSFEAELMGLSGDFAVERGPLIVSAFDWQPPSKSVHFELSLLSVDEAGVLASVDGLSRKESRVLAEQFERLATRKLTPKWGEQSTHGLVWEEGSLDLGCQRADEVVGNLWSKHLPEGDGEYMLRALIDDSLNLLDGLEVNRRRFDEGKPKANLLWPHSFGFRPDLPNLALRRGDIAWYLSDQIGIAGMARLVGYESCERREFRNGLHMNYSFLHANLCDPGTFVVIDQNLGMMLERGRGEEASYVLKKLEEKIWLVFAVDMQDGMGNQGLILCPRKSGEGLGLRFGPGVVPNGIPFDVRAWDDRRLRTLRMSETIATLLGG